MKGVILDLDDTLWHAEEGYRFALKFAGVDPDAAEFLEARAKVKSRLGPGHVSARNRILYFKTMLDKAGNFSPKRIIELMNRYEQGLQDFISKQWRELERDSFLEWLTSQYGVVLLTNETTRTQMIKLSAMDPSAKFLKSVITSEELGVEKPNPLMFDEALKLLKLRPADCAVIGDNWENDIVPSLKIGCKTFWTQEFSEKKATDGKGATLLKTLEDFRLHA